MGDDDSAKGALNSTGYRPGQSLPSSLQWFLTPPTAAICTPWVPNREASAKRNSSFSLPKYLSSAPNHLVRVKVDPGTPSWEEQTTTGRERKAARSENDQ